MEIDGEEDGKKEDEDGDEDEEDGDLDYFESDEFYEELEKAKDAARKAKAEDLLLEWIEQAKEDGDDAGTRFYEESLADLERFVAENQARLDEVLKGEELDGMPNDDTIDNLKQQQDRKKKKKKKKGKNKRGHDEAEDEDKEVLIDSEAAGPPGKKVA